MAAVLLSLSWQQEVPVGSSRSLACSLPSVCQWGKLRLLPSLLAGIGLGFLLVLLFAATMALGEGPVEALEAVSQYSDYTRNAMLVIDSHFPLQYGRLTVESQTFSRIPRFLMPSKPKNFGAFYLVDQFFPTSDGCG